MYCYHIRYRTRNAPRLPALADQVVAVARSYGQLRQIALFRDEQTGDHYLLTLKQGWLSGLPDSFQWAVCTPPRPDRLEWQAGLLLYLMDTTSNTTITGQQELTPTP